jgi:hypothetical protein
LLRTGGLDDPIVDHLGQPADYVHSDGTVWTWHKDGSQPTASVAETG